MSPLIHYNKTDALAVSTANYGLGNGPIFITRVECDGDEKNVLECGHDLRAPHCTHSEFAGVSCTGMLYTYSFELSGACSFIHRDISLVPDPACNNEARKTCEGLSSSLSPLNVEKMGMRLGN